MSEQDVKQNVNKENKEERMKKNLSQILYEDLDDMRMSVLPEEEEERKNAILEKNPSYKQKKKFRLFSSSQETPVSGDDEYNEYLKQQEDEK
eukprot:gene9086-1181_t